MNAQKRSAVAVNNACNAQTPGFKKSSVYNKDLCYENVKSRLNSIGANNAGGNESSKQVSQLGKGSDISSITRIHTQGPIQKTGRNFDFAIKGEGYFRVQTEGYYSYTRAGHFHLSSDGKSFVTDQGYIVDANVNISPEDLNYSMEIDRTTSTLKGGKDKDKILASFNVYNFQNQEKLDAIGNNLLVATSQSGVAEEVRLNDPYSAKIENNALEGANMDLYSILQEIHESKENYRLAMNILKYLNEMNSFQGNI